MAWLALLLASLALPGCQARQDPDALFKSIYGEYLHGDLALARERATRARQAFDSTWSVRFRLLEAELLLRQDRAKDAVQLLTDSGAANPREADLAIKRNLLCGLAHTRLANARDGSNELREARRLAEATHSSLIGEVLRAEGLLERDAGHLEQANEKFQASLASARQSGNALLQASDLVDLGEDSLENYHFDQALVLLRTAVEFAQSIQARRQLQLAAGNLGWAYYNLGDFERALAQFQQAEQLAARIGMTRARTHWLQNAGLADYKLGHLHEASQYEEQALQSVLGSGGDTDQVANIETNLALLLCEQGQYQAAKTHSDAATLQARDSKDNNVVAYSSFVRGLLAERLPDATDVEQTLLTARHAATDPDLQTDIETALAGLYASQHRQEPARLWYDRAIQTFEKKRSSERDEALRLAAFGYGAGVYRDYAQFLVESNRMDEALQLLDRSRARTLAEGLGFSSDTALTERVPDPRSVARKLDATLLFYSLGPQRSYLWAITGSAVRLFVLPAAQEIQAQVEEYQRAILKSSDPVRAATPAAIALFAMLLAPAAASIPADSKVFLMPDGVLHTLNFETLLEPTAAGYRYWIEHVTVTSASSIRMLARLKAATPHAPAHDLLLIGNPLATPTGLDALPNAANEIERIQQHFVPGSQTILTQAQAVPGAYARSEPNQYRYIHFVAHGTASRLSPLDSAVVLSSPPDRPDEFKLYARDIVQHPLSAELVTISTCYGSGVRTYAAEGLVGLAWVFLRAGSHNVIGALWQADDASTPLLMDRLYAGLQSGKTPAVALRAAKLAFVHAQTVYRKPFYWAPFQLYAGS